MFKKLITGLALSTALAGGALALCATTASAESNPTWVTTPDCTSTWCPSHEKKVDGCVDIKKEIDVKKENKIYLQKNENKVGDKSWSWNKQSNTMNTWNIVKKDDDKKKPVCCDPLAVQ